MDTDQIKQAQHWSDADEKGIVHMPDELDPIFNKLGMQLRFHTISGKNEMQTLVDMVAISEKFFKEKSDQRLSDYKASLEKELKDSILDEQYVVDNHTIYHEGDVSQARIIINATNKFLELLNTCKPTN